MPVVGIGRPPERRKKPMNRSRRAHATTSMAWGVSLTAEVPSSPLIRTLTDIPGLLTGVSGPQTNKEGPLNSRWCHLATEGDFLNLKARPITCWRHLIQWSTQRYNEATLRAEEGHLNKEQPPWIIRENPSMVGDALRSLTEVNLFNILRMGP